MRGIQSWKDAILLSVRIIPAHAGNTHRIRWFCVGCEDHPRSCGEYIKIHVSIPRFRGSSPLMRGILYRFVINVFRLGIIPAHAGNTHLQTNQPIFHKDHPRSCGEYLFNFSYLNNAKGSSPLMRGIHFHPFFHSSSARIIPAHAGNTERYASRSCQI